MLPKFFVTSDIHSYYSILIDELNRAGFDKNDKNHWLIVCGDCFDRGEESRELMDYLNSLSRKIIIRGNHEDLLLDLIKRGYPYIHDNYNGTVGTIRGLANEHFLPIAVEKIRLEFEQFMNNTYDYFETENYIFVHSCIPEFDYRNASAGEWNDARWNNPFINALNMDKAEFNGKTLVFGHWHTTWARENIDGEKDSDDYSPYYGDQFIGIDACVAYYKHLNVLVIEDEFIEEEE